VNEPEARAAYLAMPGRRSILRLHRNFIEDGRETPTIRTLGEWSRKHDWVALAEEHDAKVAARAGEKIAKTQIETAVCGSQVFDHLSETAAQRALAAVKKLDPAKLRATDIRALVEASELAKRLKGEEVDIVDCS